ISAFLKADPGCLRGCTMPSASSLLLRGGLTLAAVCGSLAASAAIPSSERTALTDLFEKAGGANWTNNANWCDGACPPLGHFGSLGTECQWNGIICDDAGEHVVQINLAANNLVGQLPQTLSSLANLMRLDLGNNQLEYGIPTLASLTNLQYFDVSRNHLSGTIPALTGLTNLRYFDVGSNLLAGPIPELAGLTNLKFFGANSNPLNSPIPPLTGLTNLRYFYVGFSQLTGEIPMLAGLTNLQEFDVSYNQL